MTLYRYNVSTSANVIDIMVNFISYHSKDILAHRENFFLKKNLKTVVLKLQHAPECPGGPKSPGVLVKTHC